MNMALQPTTGADVLAEATSLFKLPTLERLQEQEEDELKRHFAEVLTKLVTALKAKDQQLYWHSYRVRHFAQHLTKLLNLPGGVMTAVNVAALFHDIGKISISTKLLHKASRLTIYEFEQIKEHPTRGAIMLHQYGIFDQAVPLVHCHHERWDGTGYPNGLRGNTIPLGARIVAIADAFEVMTSHSRAYQQPRTPLEALEEIRRCAGTQFDPTLAHLFCINLKTNLQTRAIN